jgi:hypothetical protein
LKQLVTSGCVLFHPAAQQRNNKLLVNDQPRLWTLYLAPNLPNILKLE